MSLAACFARIYAPWEDIVRRNGALQLAFGLLFGVGSGKWRVACGLLVAIQLFGLCGHVYYFSKEVKEHEGDLTGNPSTIFIIIDGIAFSICVINVVITYLFAFFYVRKHGFVANVGMEFPCPPQAMASSNDHVSSTVNTDLQQGRPTSELQTYGLRWGQPVVTVVTTLDETPRRSSRATGKVKNAVNVFSLIVLAATPVICVCVALGFLLGGSPTSPVTLITAVMPFLVGLFGDVMMSVVFTSVTQNVVEEISFVTQVLSTPSSFERSSRRGDANHLQLAPQAVALLKGLEHQTSAWLDTMSPWFALHLFCYLVMTMGRLLLIFVKPSLKVWGFHFIYPLYITSFLLPLISASRVTRHWDKMVKSVLTSDQWLPDHWRDHMYLRQFLENSEGGFFVFGFRLSGSVFVSITAAVVTVVEAFHHF